MEQMDKMTKEQMEFMGIKEGGKKKQRLRKTNSCLNMTLQLGHIGIH